MYGEKVVEAFQPCLKNLIVPRLNFSALRSDVEQEVTRLSSGGGTTCSPRAEPGEYQVKHENRGYVGEAAHKHNLALEQGQVHKCQTSSKQFGEHIGNVAQELRGTKKALKQNVEFNYPHIFRKEFRKEHADQVTHSPGSSAQRHRREQPRAHDKDFPVVTEGESPSVPGLKKCRVHNSPARQKADFRDKVSSPSHGSHGNPEPTSLRVERNDKKTEGSEGRLRFPCFGLGFSSRPSSPKSAAAAAISEKRALPFNFKNFETKQAASPEPPPHTILEKRPEAFPPRITIVTPRGHGLSHKHPIGAGKHQPHEAHQDRSYFNPLHRHLQKQELHKALDMAPAIQDHRQATYEQTTAPASNASGSSSGTSIGEIHHECIYSKGSSNPPGSDRQPHGIQDYDPHARMGHREVPLPSPPILDPPTFETHLPCSIVGKCNKKLYNRNFLEGRKMDGSKLRGVQVPCCEEAETALELEEQMRTLFYTTSEQLPASAPVAHRVAYSSEWPTVARAGGSQFTTFLGNPRQGKHYVTSGRFDVLPVLTHLKSAIPPWRGQSDDAIRLHCRTCGVDVCHNCSLAQERWPTGTETAIAAQFLDEILKTETEQFNPRLALEKLARKRGITVDKLVALKACKRAAGSTKCRPRFQNLCEIGDPCCPTVAPRKVGKQVDENWLALKRRRPSVNDLWVSQDRCPQVCATAPVSSRPPLKSPAPWDSAKEQSLIWEQRISSCRAALSTMAVYDSYRV